MWVMSLCLLCSFVCLCFLFSLSSPPPLGRRKKEACCRIQRSFCGRLVVLSITIHVAVLAWLSAPFRTPVLNNNLLLTALAIPISPPVNAMAEMADLTKALDQLEVTPAASSSPKKPHEEEATHKVSGSASSPPSRLSSLRSLRLRRSARGIFTSRGAAARGC